MLFLRSMGPRALTRAVCTSPSHIPEWSSSSILLRLRSQPPAPRQPLLNNKTLPLFQFRFYAVQRAKSSHSPNSPSPSSPAAQAAAKLAGLPRAGEQLKRQAKAAADGEKQYGEYTTQALFEVFHPQVRVFGVVRTWNEQMELTYR